MDAAHAEETAHMLFYMDLDRFKAVNDSCGHMAGDNMLREGAALIKEQVRDSDFGGRLGGEEFGEGVLVHGEVLAHLPAQLGPELGLQGRQGHPGRNPVCLPGLLGLEDGPVPLAS